MTLKECVIEILSEYNHLEKILISDTYDGCANVYLTKAVELLFKNKELDSERANVIRQNI